ncbi:MAG: hypothetical protein ACRDSK_03690 [Actinophytocola sp.]|uniref:hypothetical protein n=1 Tax=Actinophytocola sp. TaxID=1872138 RepID=UPI003D6BC3FA
MYGRLFTLVTIDDDSQIFAWGIEIVSEDDREAVIYRKDPATSRTLFGLHDSAQAACERWSGIVPLEICWEDEDDLSSVAGDHLSVASDYSSEASDSATSAMPSSANGNRPRPLVTV